VVLDLESVVVVVSWFVDVTDLTISTGETMRLLSWPTFLPLLAATFSSGVAGMSSNVGQLLDRNFLDDNDDSDLIPSRREEDDDVVLDGGEEIISLLLLVVLDTMRSNGS
jgi:hypothetical protein